MSRKQLRKQATVPAQACRTIAMVNGNEKLWQVIVMSGHVYRWVGIGWVDEGKATPEDRAAYPKVLNSR